MEKNAAFAAKYDFPYRLLCDTDRSLGLALGAASSPKERFASRVSVLIDEEGKVQAFWSSVKTKTHATDVLSVL